MAAVTGPGYFVVKPAPDSGEHQGELYFDYTEFDSAAPSERPDNWPTFKPNEAGLSRLVYAHMKDYCRRASPRRPHRQGVQERGLAECLVHADVPRLTPPSRGAEIIERFAVQNRGEWG